MKVNICIRTKEPWNHIQGTTEWNLPHLPRVGERFTASAVAAAVHPLSVYDNLSLEEKEEWNKHKENLLSQDIEDAHVEHCCLVRWLLRYEPMFVEEVRWFYTTGEGYFVGLLIKPGNGEFGK